PGTYGPRRDASREPNRDDQQQKIVSEWYAALRSVKRMKILSSDCGLDRASGSTIFRECRFLKDNESTHAASLFRAQTVQRATRRSRPVRQAAKELHRRR